MDPRQGVEDRSTVTRGRSMRLPLNYILPMTAGFLFLAGWHAIVTLYQVPKFLVPSPVLIVETMINDAPALLQALRFTAIRATPSTPQRTFFMASELYRG